MIAIKKIYSITFTLFCASIPFTDLGEAIPNMILLLNLMIFPFVIKKADFYQLNKSLLFTFLALIFLITIETLVFQRWEDFKFINRLVLVPVIILLALPLKDVRLPVIGFISGAFITALISIFNILLFITKSGGFDFAVGKEINIILLGDRPYMGFVYVSSTIFALYLFKQVQHKFLKYLLLFVSCFFIVVIITISARLSLLTLLLLVFFSLFYLKEKKIIISILAGVLLIIPTFIYFNDNLKNRFFMGFEQEEISVTKMMKMEPRYHIWNCVKRLSDDNMLIWKGFGYEKTEEKLVECYQSKPGFLNNDQRNWFVESKFNTHNQFFNFFLTSGIFTPIVFIFFLGIWFWQSKNSFSKFALFFSVLLFCVLENMLSRQMGATLFGLIIVFHNILNYRLDKEV